MAKKSNLENDLPKDDTTLDSELNFPEPDFDLDPPPDDRSPAKKILDASVDQVKDSVKSKDFIGKFLRKALPDVYGEVYETASDIASSTKELYNTAAKEIKPSINELAKVTEKLVPETSKGTKKVIDRLKKWSSPEEGYSAGNAVDQKEASIAIEIADVFKAQMIEQQHQKATADAGDRVQQSLDIMRHKQSQGSFSNIDANISRLTQYQEKVTAAYQKKSLELQYRSYFVNNDALTEAKKSNENHKTILEGILKNTALPEFVKIRGSERFKEVARTKAMEALMGTTGQFVKKMFGNFKNVMSDGLNNAKEAFSMASMAGDMAGSAQEFDPRSGGVLGMVTKMGVGEAMNYAAGRAGEKVGKIIQGNEKFASKTEDLKSGFNNLPAYVTAWANEETEDNNIFKSILRSAVRSILPGQSADMSLSTDSMSNMREPTVFTNHVSKSITEIIPGFLARILREVKVLRTGDDSISIPTYDFYSNKFSDKAKLTAKIKGKLFTEGSIDVRSRAQAELMDKVDPKKELDENTRTVLINKLIKDMLTNKLVKSERLSDHTTYASDPELGSQSEKIAELMNQYFTANGQETDKTHSKYKIRDNEFNNKIRYLASAVSNPASHLQELINLGQYDEVRGTGLFQDSQEAKQKKKISELLNKYPEARDMVTVGKYKEAAKYINDKENESNKATRLLKGDKTSGILDMFGVSEYDLKPKESSDSVSLDSVISSFSKPQDTVEPAKNQRDQTSNNAVYQDQVKKANFASGPIVTNTIVPPGQQYSSQRTQDTQPIAKELARETDPVIMSLMKEILTSLNLTGTAVIKISDNMSKISESPENDKYKIIEDSLTVIKDTGVSSNDILKAILDKLHNLMLINADLTGFAQKFKDKSVEIKDTIYSKVKNITTNSFDLAKKGFGITTGLAKRSFGASKKTAKLVSKVATGVTATTANILIKKRDVFINGEVKPRLTKLGFQAGHYRDSVTGQVIKNIGDLKNIKGDIIDLSGDVVLRADEIKDTFVKSFTGFTESIVNIGKSLAGTTFKAVVGGINMSRTALGAGFNLIKRAKNFAFDLLDRPIDIYLKDNLETPILLATIMRNDGYVSATSGKVVNKPSMIDGPLKTLDGNFALTMEQLKKGIVDKDGNPIRSPLMKMLGFGIGVATKAVNTVISAGKMLGGAIMGGMGISGDFLKGFANSFKSLFDNGIGGKKSLEVLEQIRDILKDRLPGKKKSIFGDKDSDGDRDGGWQDLASKEKKTKEKTEYKDNTIKADRENAVDRLINKFQDLKDKAKSLFGFGGEEGDGPDINVDLPDGDGKDRRGKRRDKKVKKPGLLRRVGGGILDAGKAVGGFALNNAGTLVKGAAGAGALYSGYNAISDVSEGNYGSAAVNAGLATVGGALALGKLGALGSAVASAGGSALAIGGGALAGLGAIISSPVILGAAAAGLTAYGGYKLYKALKSYKPFVKLRMAQYGFTTEESNKFDALMEFENILLKQIRYDEDDNPELDDKGLDYKAIVSIFDLKMESTDRKEIEKMKKWQHWYINRFKPVFMTHVAALRKLDGKKTLESIDDSDDFELKEKYLNAVRFPEGNYSMKISPFEDIKELRAGKTVVSVNVQEIEREISKSKKDKESDKASLWQAMKDGKLSDTLKTRFDDYKKDNIFKNTKDSVSEYLSNLTVEKALAWNPVLSGLYKGSTFIGTKIQKTLGYGVDALEAIRFKAYGLVEMDRSKVIALRNMEEFIEKGISYQTDNTAIWKGSIEEIISELGGDFGISADDRSSVDIFTTWLTTRFLPTYTKYLGSLRAVTNKGEKKSAEMSLKDQDKFDIAKQLIGLDTWSKSVSPWLNYKLNTNSNSAQVNLSILEAAAKDAVLREQKAQQKKQQTQNKEAGASAVKAAAKVPEANKSAYTDRRSEQVIEDKEIDKRMEQTFGKTWRDSLSEKDKADGIAGMKIRIEKDKEQAKNAVEKVKDTVPGQKGQKRSNFGGFGGEVDSYITEAANKFGMDEKVLRGFIKMEGGWNGQMSPTGAIGTGQFIQSTWNSLAKTKEGKEIGMIPITRETFRTSQDPRHDKRINTLATALLAKQNSDQLQKAGLEPTGENLYMMHNIGPGVIGALKGGNVSEATITAMKHNGWRPGMSATDFVSFQKDRFNQHFASANNGASAPESSPTKVNDEKGQWNDYADKSKVPQEQVKPPVYNQEAKTAQTDLIKGRGQTNSKPAAITTSLAGQGQETINRSAGSYGQSVQNSKTDNSSFSSLMKTDLARVPDISGSTNNRPDQTALANSALNNLAQTLKPLNSAAVESLSVQKQMLTVLESISTKIDPTAFVNALKTTMGGQTTQVASKEDAPTGMPRPIDKQRDLSNVPVPMSKTRYS